MSDSSSRSGRRSARFAVAAGRLGGFSLLVAGCLAAGFWMLPRRAATSEAPPPMPGQPVPQLFMFSEYDGQPRIYLSAGNPTNFRGWDNDAMPNVGITLSITTLLGTNPQNGVPVSITCDPADVLNLPQNVTTGSIAPGKAKVVVWAIAGRATSPIFPVSVTARAPGYPSTTLQIYLVTARASRNAVSPVQFTPFPNRLTIRDWYSDDPRDAINKMRPYCDQRRLDWNENCASGVGYECDFVGNPDFQIRYRQEWAPWSGFYAWTARASNNASDRRRVITFNMYQLDGEYNRSANQWNFFPRLQDRHMVQTCVNHEVGHALLFRDVQADTVFNVAPQDWKGLMFFSAHNYFVWRTVVPQRPNEIDPMSRRENYGCPR